MQDQALLETWRKSVLEIQRFCKWVVLWDGASYHPERIPDEVGRGDLYIVTAYNPESKPLSDQENRDRDRRLFAQISSIGSAGSFVSVGRSLSGSHTEYGYAIYKVAKNDVDRLAREFGQIGYYRLTAKAMEIFALTDDGQFERV